MTRKQKDNVRIIIDTQAQVKEAYATMDAAMASLKSLAGQTVEVDDEEYQIIDNFDTPNTTIFKAAAFRRYEVKLVK